MKLNVKQIINIKSKIDYLKQKYNSTYNFTNLNSIIEDLYKRICDTISCNSTIDTNKFNDVYEK